MTVLLGKVHKDQTRIWIQFATVGTGKKQWNRMTLPIQISNWEMHWPEIDHLVDGICATCLIWIWIYHLVDEIADCVCVVTRLIWIGIYHLADENEDQIWIWTQGIQLDHLVDESSFSFV